MRYSGIDLLRHAFALAVIFIHTTSKSRYSPEVNQSISDISNYIDGVVMGFFIISGFFAKPKANLSIKVLKEYTKSKARRLLVPYFAASITASMGLALLGKGSIESGLISTFTLQGASMQLYFLPFLFQISLAFILYTSLMDNFGVKPVKSLIPLSIILIIVSLIFPTTESTGGSVLLIPLYAISYILGFFLSRFHSAGERQFFLAAFLLSLSLLFVSTWDSRLLDLFLVINLFTLAIYISSLPIIQNRAFPGSGGVYMLHVPFILYVISTILVHVQVQGMMNVIVSSILTYAFCLLFTLLFYKKFKRYAYLLLE